jgi:hypothetical protein
VVGILEYLCLSIHPSLNLVYVTSHLSFVGFYSYLVSWLCACSDHGQPRYQIWIKCDKRQMTSCVHKMYERIYGQTNMKRAIVICLLLDFIHIWYLDWPWSEHAHIIPISRMVDFCKSYSPFHVPLRTATINYFLNGQSRYQIWIKCDKRQMTSYVHKMCERTYDQTNMKRAITLAPGRMHISWFQHSLHSFMPLHHVKSHYNLILYYTSTYIMANQDTKYE